MQWVTPAQKWWGQQTRAVQLALACTGVLVACCACSGLLAVAGGNTTPSFDDAVASVTAAARAHQQTIAAAQPTAKATRAVTRTPTPRPTATDTPVPMETPIPLICTDAGCSPWGYAFEGSRVITSPPGALCSYFRCISNFWDGSGYVVQCANGQYSKSGGHQGACSKQGGVIHTLYQP